MKSLETLQVRVGQDRLHKIPTEYYKISSTIRVDIEEILRVSVSLGHGVVSRHFLCYKPAALHPNYYLHCFSLTVVELTPLTVVMLAVTKISAILPSG